MDGFLKKNSVLPDYHHGLRKGHSTLTVTQTFQHTLQTYADKKKNSAIVLTDLGLAFDTWEHSLLALKLTHIGIRGQALYLLKSFLENCRMLIEIQGYSSNMKAIGSKSVFAGNKASKYPIHNIQPRHRETKPCHGRFKTL